MMKIEEIRMPTGSAEPNRHILVPEDPEELQDLRADNDESASAIIKTEARTEFEKFFGKCKTVDNGDGTYTHNIS